MKESRVLEISIPNLEAIDDAAYKFMTEMGDLTVYAFYGEMGAARPRLSTPCASSWV